MTIRALAFVALIVAFFVAAPAGRAAAPAATALPAPASMLGEDCRRNGPTVLDCVCVEKEAARLLQAAPRSPLDEVADRAALACPSHIVKRQAPDDPRYRQPTLEQRVVLRRIALEFTALLDAGRNDDALARLVATPTVKTLIERMPGMREQFELRMRDLFARRAARGSQSDRRVVLIGPNHVIVEARATVPQPGVVGPSALTTQDVVKIEWSATGAPELGGYDFGY